ncbi:hypothetical protein TrCOL_g9633 [Triparma columacea]|uniref:Uncharacterized protein n=1 Tax=Triparma columacea TaxID=722753 RepID=A0A9W7GP74_9STRA|nr:hypothetical protein TrCOL_g9633 [Triparma columacea]
MLSGVKLARITLGCVIIWEVLTRIPLIQAFYTSTSTWPTSVFLPSTSITYSILSFPHTILTLDQYYPFLLLLLLHALLELGNVVDLITLPTSDAVSRLLSWYLYVSLTLRNTWLAYILDRYIIVFGLLLGFADYGMPERGRGDKEMGLEKFLHLYLDASLSKYNDPSRGWTSNPTPPTLPALDTYTRHTYFARIIYTILGPDLLAQLTPTVVYAYVTGSVYYNVFEVGTCSQTTSWVPTVMFNRWNVFTSSEEYVTWEVAVGTFNDGRVEDVWRGEGGEVDWRLPDVGGIKKRGGRWRSFQYLAEGTAEQEEALWGWMCGENEGLVEYEFWMVKAMTERDMGYGGSRKRLVKKWKCEREEETEGRDKGEREGIEEEEKGGSGNSKQNENSKGNDEF